VRPARYASPSAGALVRAVSASLLAAATVVATADARAIDVDDVGGETLTIDVSNTAAVAWRFDNRNDTAVGNPTATTIVDDNYGEWLDRFNVQLYYWRLRAGMRLDTALYADRFTRDQARDFAREQLGGGATTLQRNDYATSFFREMNTRYRNAFYPSKLFVGYTAPGVDLTFGDFYAQLGRGLVFSVRKVDELAVDTTVRGGKVDIDQTIGDVRIAGQIFGGQMNPLRVDEQSGRRLNGNGSAMFFGFPTGDDFPYYGFDAAGNVVPLTSPARPSYLEDTAFGGGLEVGPKLVSFGANGSLLLRKDFAADYLACEDAATTPAAQEDCAAQFPVFTTNNQSRLHNRIATFSGSVRVPDIAEHGDVYIEVAGQNQGDGRQTNVAGDSVADLDGYALYGSGTVRGGPIAFNVEGKHYRSFFPLSANVNTVDTTFGASEFDTVAYNQVPTAEPIYVQTLGQPNICVSGGRGRADVRFKKEASLYAWLGRYVSYSEIDALNATCETEPELTTHAWDGAVGADLEFEKGRSFIKAWTGFRNTDREVAEQTVNTAAATTAFYREGYIRYDVAKHISGDFTIQAQGWHRHRYEPDFAIDSWNEGENYTALQWAPKWSFIFGYEYLAREGCEPDPETGVCHYVSGGVQYKAEHNDSALERLLNTVNLFVGQRRGAIRCVSGVCRRFPPFEGARLEITSRF
jgi:hypothetical protein